MLLLEREWEIYYINILNYYKKKIQGSIKNTAKCNIYIYI